MEIKIIWILFALFALGSALHLQFNNGARISFNTSMTRDIVSISLESNGKRNTSFFVQSEILSPLRNPYQLIHSEGKIDSEPLINEDYITFNDHDDFGYWLALKHPIKFADVKNVQFVTLKLYETKSSSIHEYLLATFPQPFSFLPIQSIYRCSSVIISFFKSQNGIDVSLFSQLESGEDWIVDDRQWDWDFKKSNDRFNFGRQTRKILSEKVKIELTNGKYCILTPNEIKSNDNSLKKSGYLTFNQVLAHAVELQILNNSQL